MTSARLPLFVESPEFTSRWSRLGLFDGDLAALQWVLIAEPTVGSVIEKTGGFRKMRFAPPSMQRGKSGGTRVIYLHLPHLHTLVLGTVYAKGEKATLNAMDKKALTMLSQVYERILTRHFGRRE